MRCMLINPFVSLLVISQKEMARVRSRWEIFNLKSYSIESISKFVASVLKSIDIKYMPVKITNKKFVVAYSNIERSYPRPAIVNYTGSDVNPVVFNQCIIFGERMKSLSDDDISFLRGKIAIVEVPNKQVVDGHIVQHPVLVV